MKSETTPLNAAPTGDYMAREERAEHTVAIMQERDTITNVCEAFGFAVTCGLFGLCGLFTAGPLVHKYASPFLTLALGTRSGLALLGHAFWPSSS